MAKKAANKKRGRKPPAARKPQAQPQQDQQDQPDPKESLPLPRFPRLRLSSLKSPPPFRLAGGLLKDEE